MKQRSENEGKRAQRQFWGTKNIENEDFDFGQQGNKAINFMGTMEQVVPPLGGPHACLNN